MNKGCIMFVQKRAHKAGAQTCLARLLSHERIRALNPVLLVSERGWLTAQCERLGVPFIEKAFPSSRSLVSLLLRNKSFSEWSARQVRLLGYEPRIIQANDHLEGLIALKLAGISGARSAIFLRSSGMTREDFIKYKCHEFDRIFAIGEDLLRNVSVWGKGPGPVLLYDGIYTPEVLAPKKKSRSFPGKLLVIGSAHAQKGWPDFTDALYILQRKKSLPPLEVDFTGDMPDAARDGIKLKRLTNIKFNFLGRVEDFAGLVLKYGLVINPTRGESFGMAAIEALAAGVPVFSSRTGVIEQVQVNEHLLFMPNYPEGLARSMAYLIENWDGLDIDVAGCQRNILKKFNIDDSAKKLAENYKGMLSER